MSLRRAISLTLLLVCGGFTVYIITTLLWLSIFSREAHLDTTRGDATVALWTKTGTIGFEGDCIHLEWDVQHIWAIYLNGRDTTGTDSNYPCVFAWQQPTFEVVFPEDVHENFTLPIGIMYSAEIRILVVAAAFIAALAGISLLPVEVRQDYIRRHDVLIALIIAVASVGALDVLTNSLDIFKLRWDHIYYIGLTVGGYVEGNPWMAAPFAYRFTPVIVRALMDGFGVSYPVGFTIVAYVGAIAQLWFTYRLAKQLGANFKMALVAMTVVALSMFNVKFLLFDVYRPDHLAFPLMTLATLYLLRRNYLLTLIFSAIGLLFREYAIIIPACLVVMVIVDAWRSRRPALLLWIVVAGAVCGAIIAVPRMQLHVSSSAQVLDFAGDWQSVLLSMPANMPRNLNILLSIATLTLPVWGLLTLSRLRWMLSRLKPYGVFLSVYVLVLAVLTMYGGGDTYRYLAYLSIPIVIVLTCLLFNVRIHPVEIAAVLIAFALINRIFSLFPVNDADLYLDFIAVHDDRLGAFTWVRQNELIAAFIGMWLLRGALYVWQPVSSKNKIASPQPDGRV